MSYSDLTVVLDDVLDPDWGNNVRDRVVNSFANATARDSAITPALRKVGMVTHLEDLKVVEVWNGTAWVPVGGGIPICQLSRAAVQSLPYGTTANIQWDAHTDPWGMHSLVTSTDRITPKRPGTYAVVATVEVAYGASPAGFHAVIASKNGLGVTDYKCGNQVPPVNGVPTRVVASGLISCNGSTDYITIGALNASGGGSALDATALGSIYWVSA